VKAAEGELQVRVTGGLPRSFRWRGRRYTVRAVLERWKETGRWWEGEASKFFFRVETTGGGLWELYFDTGTRTWRLYRVYD